MSSKLFRYGSKRSSISIIVSGTVSFGLGCSRIVQTTSWRYYEAWYHGKPRFCSTWGQVLGVQNGHFNGITDFFGSLDVSLLDWFDALACSWTEVRDIWRLWNLNDYLLYMSIWIYFILWIYTPAILYVIVLVICLSLLMIFFSSWMWVFFIITLFLWGFGRTRTHTYFYSKCFYYFFRINTCHREESPPTNKCEYLLWHMQTSSPCVNKNFPSLLHIGT